jgi:hypothetical protein
MKSPDTNSTEQHEIAKRNYVIIHDMVYGPVVVPFDEVQPDLHPAELPSISFLLKEGMALFMQYGDCSQWL